MLVLGKNDGDDKIVEYGAEKLVKKLRKLKKLFKSQKFAKSEKNS